MPADEKNYLLPIPETPVVLREDRALRHRNLGGHSVILGRSILQNPADLNGRWVDRSCVGTDSAR